MKFVSLKQVDTMNWQPAGEVHINPAFIAAIEPHYQSQAHTALTVHGGRCYFLSGTPDQIRKAVEAATSSEARGT